MLWTEEAVRDLEEIVAYIAEDSPGQARRIFRKMQTSATKLETPSARGPPVPELSDLGLSLWRELVVKPWRILCRISAETVLVKVVKDSRRDAEALLFDRLLRQR